MKSQKLSAERQGKVREFQTKLSRLQTSDSRSGRHSSSRKNQVSKAHTAKQLPPAPLKQKSYRFSDTTENPLQLKSQVFAIGEDGGLITEQDVKTMAEQAQRQQSSLGVAVKQT